MTLDEAIRHAKEVAEIKKTESETAEIQGCDRYALKCEKCASEHRQLAEWLKDYKRLKEQPEITWVTGTDGAKVAFWDVPIPKVLKICEILQEPTVTSTEDNAEMVYPQVEGITPTVVLDETQDQLDFVQPHKKIPVTLTVQKEKTCDGCLFQQYPRITICQECSRYYSDNYVKE